MDHVDYLMYIIRSMRMSISFATDVITALRITPNTYWVLRLKKKRGRERGKERRKKRRRKERREEGGREGGTFFPPWARQDLN